MLLRLVAMEVAHISVLRGVSAHICTLEAWGVCREFLDGCLVHAGRCIDAAAFWVSWSANGNAFCIFVVGRRRCGVESKQLPAVYQLVWAELPQDSHLFCDTRPMVNTQR